MNIFVILLAIIVSVIILGVVGRYFYNKKKYRHINTVAKSYQNSMKQLESSMGSSNFVENANKFIIKPKVISKRPSTLNTIHQVNIEKNI